MKVHFKSQYLFAWLALLFTVAGCFPGSNRQDEFIEYDPAQYERVDINYKINGVSDTTLIFIHGWNLNKTYWDAHVPYFSRKYKVVTLDLAGHGRSGKNRKNWTAESFARDITNIVKKESLQNIILVAHGFGGEIALQVFKQLGDPVVGIVGVDTFKDVEFALTSSFRRSFLDNLDKFKRNYAEMAGNYARENIRSIDRDVINRIVKDYKSADPKIALTIYKNMLPKREEDKSHLQLLPFPLYIIASSFQPVNEEALKKYAKSGYHLRYLEETGHFPMVEQPEQFQQALHDVLRLMKVNRSY